MLEQFIKEWFPKSSVWDNIGKFILESGVELTEDINSKWLSGYTNIGKSHKPTTKMTIKNTWKKECFNFMIVFIIFLL